MTTKNHKTSKARTAASQRKLDPNKPVRFAVVGCGMLARSQHIPNIARSKRMTLQVCCDVSEAALKECREKHGAKRTTKDFHDAVNDPEVDAICLATTEKLRLPVIAAAAAAGKAIFVEKPLARTLEEVYEIQKVVHKSGIPFCVGHNRRSSPAMIEAHRIFRDHMEHPKPSAWRWDREPESRPRMPDLGVAGMSVRINDDILSWKGWVYDKKETLYGPMLFEMTHFTDLCNWFLDAEPVEVVALEQGLQNHGVVIRYKTGELATILMAVNGTFGYPKELYEVMGQGGLVAIDHMVEVRTAGITGAPAQIKYPLLGDRHPKVGKEGGIQGWLAKKLAACNEAAAKGEPTLQFTAEPDKGHAHAMEHFVDQIHGRGPEVCGVDSAVLATRVCFAALKAVKNRRVVKLSEI